MSLISSLHTSFIGLRNTELHLNAASQNVSNADKVGYTRKITENRYTTTTSGTVPTSGKNITANYNQFLYRSMVEDSSDSGYARVKSNFLSSYAIQLGQTDGDSTLSSALDDYAAALDILAQTPEEKSAKSGAIRKAEFLTYEVRNLSSAVQDLRKQADKDIETAVTVVNQSLSKIESLNEQIRRAEVADLSTADLEDERRLELETVSTYMNVDYFINEQNQVQIFAGGRALLDSTARTLEYTAQNAVNKTVVYPAGFSPISINGFDMTPLIRGGEIGSLIDLRDNLLVDEQEKLDEFANVLRTQMNILHNQGSSLPARSDMTGFEKGFAGGTVFTATGLVKISTLDINGEITATADIDLSTTPNIGALVAAINGALGPNVTASLTADGELQLTANNAGEGVALNQLTSNVSGNSFSQFFGLNNLFEGTGADDLFVSEYLRDNSDFLSTSRLSATAIVGESGVDPGDGTLTEEIQNLVFSNVAFNAAGNFGAQNSALISYSNRIMADVATNANNATRESETVDLLYNQTKTSLQNISGVNIDEEMVKITELESKYQAAATLIGTLRSLFDELIAAVR